ncbi:MAG: alpha/beta hydrolase-fold protein [Rikenellaceae bacterium]
MKFIFTLLAALAMQVGVMAHTPMPLAEFPEITSGKAAAGKFVRETESEYKGTEVHHCIYLPENHDIKRKKSYPIIVELTGNKWPHGSGEVEEAHLGYSITLGRDYIWVVMPYIAEDHRHNEVTWWGDNEASVEYMKTVLPRIAKRYNGDMDNMVLCGFSRGSIGVSYVGLHDEDIAKMWRGFITHDHFDGAREWNKKPWGSPLEKFRAEATVRLRRAAGKPWFLSAASSLPELQSLVKEIGVDTMIDFTYSTISMKSYFTIPNDYFKHSHNDCWPLFDTPEGNNLREWLYGVTGTAPER